MNTLGNNERKSSAPDFCCVMLKNIAHLIVIFMYMYTDIRGMSSKLLKITPCFPDKYKKSALPVSYVSISHFLTCTKSSST